LIGAQDEGLHHVAGFDVFGVQNRYADDRRAV
jgi:hypothetical protein